MSRRRRGPPAAHASPAGPQTFGRPAKLIRDETIDAVYAVGRMLPRELKCTALGGLSLAPSALAMRRLKVIDLSTGDQPIHNQDKTLWIVFNGEIYNFPELRRALESRGHRFATQSDTEVLLRGYREWGVHAMVPKLRGMFAFATREVGVEPFCIS